MTTQHSGQDRIGFLGLGRMGLPMASHLLRAGLPLRVWNRSAPALEAAERLGARPADSVEDLFAASDIVIVMLANQAAMEGVLYRTPGEVDPMVRGRLVVGTGTVAPSFSARLAEDIARAGGAYVETPVSGSQRPAEAGTLVTMLAGAPEDLDRVEPIVALWSSSVVRCGATPNALRMKLASNAFLIATVTGLAEAFQIAERQGLDLDVLRSVLDSGQMASAISRVKTEKLVTGDFTPQASIADVLMNCELALDAAAESGAAAPLLGASRALYADAVSRGDGGLDMSAVLHRG